MLSYMKLITLNTWGGRIRQPFLQFISSHQDVDVFCFQEVFDSWSPAEGIPNDGRGDLFSALKKSLPNHEGLFCECNVGEGLAMFVKKDFRIVAQGDVLVYNDPA